MKWVGIGILVAIVAVTALLIEIHVRCCDACSANRAKRRLRKGYAKKRALNKDGRPNT